MATTTAERRPSGFAGFVEGLKQVPTFVREARHEMRKVTWPDKAQLRSATLAIIAFVLLVGAVIWVMDIILQAVLVRGIPAIFGA
jgi:preprotein translocase subunit SecE